jgi:para-nitrobenzyl esterase
MKARHFALAFALLAAPVLSLQAWAQAPAPAAPASPYSVATTTIGELLDHPALKAIFVKYLPDIANNERIEEGRALTLPDIVQYVPDQVTPDKLAAIDMELKALPPQ